MNSFSKISSFLLTSLNSTCMILFGCQIYPKLAIHVILYALHITGRTSREFFHLKALEIGGFQKEYRI